MCLAGVTVVTGIEQVEEVQNHRNRIAVWVAPDRNSPIPTASLGTAGSAEKP
jgi:hypothetical protein